MQAPEPIVADLFFDWANLVMLAETLESAEALYLQALQFGADDAPLVRRRLAHVQAMLKKYRAGK